MVTPAVTGGLLEFNRSGKLRILAVTSPNRLIAAPEIPTAVEAGLPGMISQQSIGLFAPAGTPTAIIEQISQATRTALAEPAYRQMLIESGFEPDVEFKPRDVPAPYRRRHCPVDAGRQSNRIEAGLKAARRPRDFRARPMPSGVTASPRRCKCGKAAFEIADQIVDVLESDVQAHGRPAGHPFRRGADAGAVEWNGQALKAAP